MRDFEHGKITDSEIPGFPLWDMGEPPAPPAYNGYVSITPTGR